MIQEILQKQKKELIIIASVLGGLILVLIISFFWAKSANGEIKEEVAVTPEEVIVNPFEDIRLSAHSAIIKEISTRKKSR